MRRRFHDSRCLGPYNLHAYQLPDLCQSCTFGVEFSPTNVGTIKGVVTVSRDAMYGPQEVSLSGTAH
jgi:hypothetical protein